MNSMNMLSVSGLQLFPFALNGTKCQVIFTSLHFFFTDVSLYKREALFAGIKNNWCVHTINYREQSFFSGEIWTLQHYHLLLSLKQAVQRVIWLLLLFTAFTMQRNTLLYWYIWSSILTDFMSVALVFYSVSAQCVSYIMSKMFCYTDMCSYVI